MKRDPQTLDEYEARWIEALNDKDDRSHLIAIRIAGLGPFYELQGKAQRLATAELPETVTAQQCKDLAQSLVETINALMRTVQRLQDVPIGRDVYALPEVPRISFGPVDVIDADAALAGM